MVASRVLVTGFIAAASASLHADTNIFATLLKRQEPGTPAYNCHDNCGTAITISKAGGDVCSDDVFLFDYKNCLQCAGPDNYNIWRYYGSTLSSVAAECGLDTEPVSGKQDDVPEAQHPGDSSGESPSSATTEAPEAPTTATPSPTAAPIATSEGDATTDDAPTATEGTATEGGPTTAAEAPEPTTDTVPTDTGAVSGPPSAPTNGTGSFTSAAPTEFTGSAAALQLSNAASAFGFALLGALFGLGY